MQGIRILWSGVPPGGWARLHRLRRVRLGRVAPAGPWRGDPEEMTAGRRQIEQQRAEQRTGHAVDFAEPLVAGEDGMRDQPVVGPRGAPLPFFVVAPQFA